MRAGLAFLLKVEVTLIHAKLWSSEIVGQEVEQGCQASQLLLFLRCSQQAYNEQEDILRPYSSLSYAWDEPSLPHRLVISQPGNRKLGVFNLDKVEHSSSLA